MLEKAKFFLLIFLLLIVLPGWAIYETWDVPNYKWEIVSRILMTLIYLAVIVGGFAILSIKQVEEVEELDSNVLNSFSSGDSSNLSPQEYPQVNVLGSLKRMDSGITELNSVSIIRCNKTMKLGVKLSFLAFDEYADLIHDDFIGHDEFILKEDVHSKLGYLMKNTENESLSNAFKNLPDINSDEYIQKLYECLLLGTNAVYMVEFRMVGGFERLYSIKPT